MKIHLQHTSENLVSLMRRVGYRPARNRQGVQNFIRPAGGGAFPRFHIYPDHTPDGVVLDLHLDQRRPSYEGTRAHGGEHTGPAVEREVERIKSILL